MYTQVQHRQHHTRLHTVWQDTLPSWLCQSTCCTHKKHMLQTCQKKQTQAAGHRSPCVQSLLPQPPAQLLLLQLHTLTGEVVLDLQAMELLADHLSLVFVPWMLPTRRSRCCHR